MYISTLIWPKQKKTLIFFLIKISNIIEEFESDFIVMCGDWNLV